MPTGYPEAIRTPIKKCFKYLSTLGANGHGLTVGRYARGLKKTQVSICFASNQQQISISLGQQKVSGVEIIGIAEYDAVVPDEAGREAGEGSVIILRKPVPEDGQKITALVRSAPPLDSNSAYFHLIQCSHFADTCVVAERSGVILGWLAAHRPPSAPEQLFVWQVAVDPSARGLGLASRMLDALASRDGASDAAALTATVTKDNEPSWALFKAFARSRGAQVERAPLFDRARHFGGTQDTEWLITVAPLNHTKSDQ